MSQRPIDRLLPLLQKVKQQGKGWEALCPAHDDQHPSLHLAEGSDGRVLLNCKVGCDVEAIVGAVGLTIRDLFPPREPKKREVCAYDYTDENGVLLYQVVRYDPKDFKQRQPGAQGWIWNLRGVRPVLFRLPAVLAAREAGEPIYVAEGEKDALTLERWGLVGTTNSGGANEPKGKKWLKEHTEALAGAKVILLPHNDRAGLRHMEQVGAELLRVNTQVKLVRLPDLAQKGDVSDWAAAGHRRPELEELCRAAPLWTPPPEPEPDEGAEPARGYYQKNFSVTKLRKVLTDPPLYYVSVFDGEIEMTVDDLFQYERFSKLVMARMHHVPDMRNPLVNWRAYLEELHRTVLVLEEAPEEASTEAAVWFATCRYLDQQGSEEEERLAENLTPFRNERMIYFHGPTLHKHLNGRGLRIEMGRLWTLLRKRGADHGLKKVRDSEGAPRVLKAWSVEKDAIQLVTPGNPEEV